MKERVQRFKAVLRLIAPDLPVKIWRDGNVMIHEVKPLLPDAVLISLDHDLEPLPGGPDSRVGVIGESLPSVTTGSRSTGGGG